VGLEFAGDVAEGCLRVRAEGGDAANDDHGDQSGDQRILDRGHGPAVAGQFLQSKAKCGCHHRHLPVGHDQINVIAFTSHLLAGQSMILWLATLLVVLKCLGSLRFFVVTFFVTAMLGQACVESC